MSPNVLEKYPDGTTCRWNIYIPSGKIALHISKSDAENSTSCDYDNLKVSHHMLNTNFEAFRFLAYICFGRST